MSTTENVVFSQRGSLRHIELNKPKAINALGEDMIMAIAAQLKQWKTDPEISAVLITGRGERGLCAGGDIKAIYRSIVEDTDDATNFWGDEYAMNYDIANYPKPYIAIMDGITMGGGVGVSAHGSHRIVTERSKVGMPETGIGLFPDVGATKLLSAMPNHMGVYLGLTGTPISAGDAIAYGLADYFVPSAELESLTQSLAEPGADVDELIRAAAQPAPEGELGAHREWIDEAFGLPTLTEIIAHLRDHPEPAAREAGALIESKSPQSVTLTYEMIRTAAHMSLAEVLERDFRAACEIVKYPDLREGIRAQVVDKDRNPQWQPARLDDVDPARIDSILHTEQTRKVFS